MNIEDAKSLALIYAGVKLNELQTERRKHITLGNLEMSDEEIQYLESAYWFAFERLK